MPNNKSLQVVETYNLGQLPSIGDIVGPTKVRISGRFIPGFTINLTKEVSSKERVGILGLIKPKITFMIAGKAYEVPWGSTRIKEVSPEIFNKPTFLDSINRTGILSVIAAIALTSIIITSIIIKRKS